MDSLAGVMPFLCFFYYAFCRFLEISRQHSVFWGVCFRLSSGGGTLLFFACAVQDDSREGWNILFVWLACDASKVYFLAICMLRRQHAVCWGMRGRSRTASEWEIVRVKIMRILFVYLHVWPIRKTGLSANYTYWHKTISCLSCLM